MRRGSARVTAAGAQCLRVEVDVAGRSVGWRLAKRDLFFCDSHALPAAIDDLIGAIAIMSGVGRRRIPTLIFRNRPPDGAASKPSALSAKNSSRGLCPLPFGRFLSGRTSFVPFCDPAIHMSQRSLQGPGRRHRNDENWAASRRPTGTNCQILTTSRGCGGEASQARPLQKGYRIR